MGWAAAQEEKGERERAVGEWASRPNGCSGQKEGREKKTISFF
jgi:hypothetical protein